MVKIVNMETVVQLPMIVKLNRYSPEPHNVVCKHRVSSLSAIKACRYYRRKLLARVLRLYGIDRQHGDCSTISDLMCSPKQSRVRRSKLIAWRSVEVLRKGSRFDYLFRLHYIFSFFFLLSI